MKVVDDPNVSGRNEEMNSLLVGVERACARATRASGCRWTGRASPGKVADAFNESSSRTPHGRRARRGCARSSARKASSGSAASLRRRRAASGRESIDSVNALIDDLVHPTSETARVIGAVAQGDLSQDDGARGRRPAARRASSCAPPRPINKMVDQLGSFASEVTRVAREVGTEGKLGGQAKVKGVAGTWKDLTDSRELDGRQPDRPGAQHRRRDDGRGQRRPVEEDHGRREGRDPRAEEHHQHDGGPAALVRLGSDARGARGRHRRQARRPGARRRRVGHVEGPDRQRELRWPAT